MTTPNTTTPARCVCGQRVWLCPDCADLATTGERVPVGSAESWTRALKERALADEREHEAAQRLFRASPALLASCKEMRDALAIALHFAVSHGLVDTLLDEMARDGIADGIGVRASQAIKEAEGDQP